MNDDMRDLGLLYESQVAEAFLFKSEKGKPMWGRVTLEFADDNDRALFIATSKNPSAHQPEYIKALTDAGMTMEDIQSRGMAIRQNIKQLVGPDNQTPRVLTIPSSNKPTA
jgi:hypothetical protein